MEPSGLLYPLGVSVLSPAPGRHRRRGKKLCAGKSSLPLHFTRTSLFCIRAAARLPAFSKFLSYGNLQIPQGLSWSFNPSLLKSVWADPGQVFVKAGPTPSSKSGLRYHLRKKAVCKGRFHPFPLIFGLGRNWDIFSELIKLICLVFLATLNPWPQAV